jgi:hypothetical protein
MVLQAEGVFGCEDFAQHINYNFKKTYSSLGQHGGGL